MAPKQFGLRPVVRPLRRLLGLPAIAVFAVSVICYLGSSQVVRPQESGVAVHSRKVQCQRIDGTWRIVSSAAPANPARADCILQLNVCEVETSGWWIPAVRPDGTLNTFAVPRWGAQLFERANVPWPFKARWIGSVDATQLLPRLPRFSQSDIQSMKSECIGALSTFGDSSLWGQNRWQRISVDAVAAARLGIMATGLGFCAAGAVRMIWPSRRERRQLRQAAGLCVACEYPLATDDLRCPECGSHSAAYS